MIQKKIKAEQTGDTWIPTKLLELDKINDKIKVTRGDERLFYLQEKEKLTEEMKKWNNYTKIKLKYEAIINNNKQKEKERKERKELTAAEKFAKEKEQYESALKLYNEVFPEKIEKAKGKPEYEFLKEQRDILGNEINEKSPAIKEGMKRQRLAETNERIERRNKNMYSSSDLDTLILGKDFHEKEIKRLKKEISDIKSGKAKKLRLVDDQEQISKDKDKIEGYEGLLKKDDEKIKNKKMELDREQMGKILTDSIKGKQGQGLFIKNVMRTYFKSMPVTEQRSMLAGALRNCKNRKGPGFEPDDQIEKNQTGDILGGMFKGAGPLFQKMLQGIPTTGLPAPIKKAIQDTQDSLSSIPEDVVRNQMNSIIKRSNGRIEKIEVVESLGAASVGQAFLCKVYGPSIKDGKNVVVKLLRPDARQRMEREKEIMLKAARMTDRAVMSPAEIKEMEEKGRKGGMESTYLGNLKRIEEELDLNIEAENCRKGAVYDEKIRKSTEENFCNSMKLSDLAEPSADSCVMEIAGTKTLKKYISDINALIARLEDYVEMKEDEEGKRVFKVDNDGALAVKRGMSQKERGEFEELRKQLVQAYDDVEQKQKGLLQLSEKWVTEGIYEKGFYHGDLHAGNIMVGENGVTVIDFGNATELSKDQQKHIIKMMASAAMGDVDLFRSSFHALLENTPEEIYQEKREELTQALKEIFSMGDASLTGERIAVALTKAQELGLELPPVVANFSSGQLRLQNTVTEMNSMFEKLRDSCKMLGHTPMVRNHDRDKIDLTYRGVAQANNKSNVQDAKENFNSLISRFELKSKELFLSDLDKKTDAREFCSKYKITQSIREEKARLDRILRHETYFSYNEENKIRTSNNFAAAFPALWKFMRQTKDESQKKLMQGVFDHVAEMVKDRIAACGGNMYISIRAQSAGHPELAKATVGDTRLGVKKDGKEGRFFNSVDEIVNYLRENNEEAAKEWKEAKGFIPEGVKDSGSLYGDFVRLIEEKKAGSITRQEFETRADELWTRYESNKEFVDDANAEAIGNRNEYLRDIANIFPVNEYGRININLGHRFEQWKQAIKGITDYNTSEEFGTKAKEMEEEYEKCIKVAGYADNNGQELLAKFNDFAKVMLDNSIIAAKNCMNSFSEKDLVKTGKYDEKIEVKNFLNTMGEVINKYLSWTMWQLGVVGNYKAKKMMKKQGVSF